MRQPPVLFPPTCLISKVNSYQHRDGACQSPVRPFSKAGRCPPHRSPKTEETTAEQPQLPSRGTAPEAGERCAAPAPQPAGSDLVSVHFRKQGTKPNHETDLFTEIFKNNSTVTEH